MPNVEAKRIEARAFAFEIRKIKRAVTRRLQMDVTATVVSTKPTGDPVIDYSPFHYLSSFSKATSVALSESKNRLAFYNVSGLETGLYRICFQHSWDVYDVGLVMVRASCDAGQVAVDGICVRHCPAGMVPISGSCRDTKDVKYTNPALILKRINSQLDPPPEIPEFLPEAQADSSTNAAFAVDTRPKTAKDALLQNVQETKRDVDGLPRDESNPNIIVLNTNNMNPYLETKNVSVSMDVCDGQGDERLDKHQRMAAMGDAGIGAGATYDAGGGEEEETCQATTYIHTTTRAGGHDESQTIMVPIKMHNPDATRNHIFNRSSEDPERKYYEYRFKYEIATILDSTPERFLVASISEGSVIVNTIFTSLGENKEAQAAATDEQAAADTRKPTELLFLLKALQSDDGSLLYLSNFFKYMDRDYVLKDVYVALCPDNTYRTLCPYMDSLRPRATIVMIFLFATLAVTLVCTGICVGAWRTDYDTADVKRAGKEFFQKANKSEPGHLDPSLQTEYAKSWLEGRYMGDDI